MRDRTWLILLGTAARGSSCVNERRAGRHLQRAGSSHEDGYSVGTLIITKIDVDPAGGNK